MSTHNLCFEKKYEKYQNFLSENFHFLVVKLSVYLNRHVFVMNSECCDFMCEQSIYNQCFSHMGTDMGSVLPETRKHRDFLIPYVKRGVSRLIFL